jgi:hypothetical protein
MRAPNVWCNVQFRATEGRVLALKAEGRTQAAVLQLISDCSTHDARISQPAHVPDQNIEPAHAAICSSQEF